MAIAMISPKFYGFNDIDGEPLAFGKVYTYQAGTNTPKPTYTSENATTENTNPVILNAAGYADIYLSGSYKVVVKDANDVEVWTADPVSDLGASLTPWIEETAAYQVAPNQFKVTGNKTDVFRYGTAVKLDDTVIFYGVILGSSYMSGETTVTIDAVDNLTADLNRVWVSLVGTESILPVLKGEGEQTLIDAVTESLATFEPRMQLRFNNLLANSGYQFIGNYQLGIEVTEYNQVIRDVNGELWRADTTTSLPYTTTGAGMPEGGAFVSVGDAVLRQELAAPGGAGLVGNGGIVFDSVADMKSAAWLTVGQKVRALGYYTSGDGGGNDYEIVAAGTGTDDGGSFIDLFGSGLQAKGLFSSSVNVKQYGAKGDGLNDDTSSIINCIKNAGNIVVEISRGVYKINQSIVIERSSTKIIGVDGKSGRTGGSAVVLDFSDIPAGTTAITVQDNQITSINNCCIENIEIKKNTTDEQESGSIGLNMAGAHFFRLKDIYIHGFSVGLRIGRGFVERSFISEVDRVNIDTCSKNHVVVEGAADIVFNGCSFTQRGDVVTLCSLSRHPSATRNSTDAIHFNNCFFINPNATGPLVYTANVYWATFTSCVFEGANSAPVGVMITRDQVESKNLTSANFVNCWTDGFTESALKVVNSSVTSYGCRWQCGSTTAPVVSISATSTFDSKTYFSGGIIAANSTTSTLVHCSKTNYTAFDGVTFYTTSAVNGVIFDADSRFCKVGSTCKLIVGSEGVVDNSILGDPAPESYEILYSAPSSGTLSDYITHGISGLPSKIILIKAYHYEAIGSGAIREADIGFVDGTRINLLNVPASRTIKVYVRYKRV